MSPLRFPILPFFAQLIAQAYNLCDDSKTKTGTLADLKKTRNAQRILHQQKLGHSFENLGRWVCSISSYNCDMISVILLLIIVMFRV